MARRIRFCILIALVAGPVWAQENQTVELASGGLTLTAPASWKSVPPRSRMLEHEMAIEAPEGSGVADARLTIMSAGGSVEANLARWVGQFQGTEGGADRSEAVIEQAEAGGMKVTLFDHAGTYLESAGGPFGPKTPRADYRMLAAIVETGFAGNYFVKLVGPAEVVSPGVERFRAMVMSAEKKP